MASVIRGDDKFDSATGGSTTYGAVGTYLWASRFVGPISENSTVSGSSIEPGGFVASNYTNMSDDSYIGVNMTKGGSTLSGTWRMMGRSVHNSGTLVRQTLYLRIS